MAECISHQGIVISQSGDKVEVRLQQTSACASCHARQMCMSTESKTRILEAVAMDSMQVGDVVEVSITEQLAWRGVLLAYIMPFVVLISAVTILDKVGYSEVIAGSMALVGCALYFVVLRLFRSRLQRRFSIKAHKCNNQ